MDIILLPIAALVLCAGLHLIGLDVFPRLRLLDRPGKYGLRRPPLPYPTGIFAILLFVSFFALLTPRTAQTAGILLGISLLALISFIDDRRGLPPSFRLAVQACAAFVLFATGTRIYTLTNPLEGWLGMGPIIPLDTIDVFLPFPASRFPLPAFLGPLPFWSGAFTLFWLLLTINALNWFDGIPGQVSLLSFIGFCVIGLLALSARVRQPDLALLSFILAGIAGSCLLFDFPPARVVMGDTGSMFFGLMLGILTIMSGGKVATAFLVLGVPLIDAGIVVMRRMGKRASLFRGNARDEHLHHRLLAKGWTQRRIIALTALLGTSFGVTALFLSTKGKFAAAILLSAVMLVLSRYSNAASGQPFDTTQDRREAGSYKNAL